MVDHKPDELLHNFVMCEPTEEIAQLLVQNHLGRFQNIGIFDEAKTGYYQLLQVYYLRRLEQLFLETEDT